MAINCILSQATRLINCVPIQQTTHKNYKYLSDHDEENTFDVEKYLKKKDEVRLRSSTVVDVFELNN